MLYDIVRLTVNQFRSKIFSYTNLLTELCYISTTLSVRKYLKRLQGRFPVSDDLGDQDIDVVLFFWLWFFCGSVHFRSVE